MELGQLRIFLAVIDHHGFRRAAAKLYLSQPAVSRHIAALEHSLGVELFRRENGRTWLTPAGERFAERAERILDDCDAGCPRGARRVLPGRAEDWRDSRSGRRVDAADTAPPRA